MPDRAGRHLEPVVGAVHRRRSLRRALLLIAATAFALGAASDARAQVELTAGSLTSGGTTISNDTYTVRGAVVPSAVGISVNDTYGVGSGFWFTTRDRVAIGIEAEGGPGGDVPETFQLDQNYPNPFNPSTTLRYGLPEPAHVRIEVYNVLGQRIGVLVDAEKPAGYHEVQWDATVEGMQAPTGLYLYRMVTDTFTRTRKMLLVR